MLRLLSTDKLQAVLAGAPATTQPQVVACFSDQTTSGYTGGKQVTTLNGVTDVDILAAPAASTVRDVDFLSIFNLDTASITVTIKYDISATDSTIIKVTLATLETLSYMHGSGWKVIDANGNLKTSAVSTGPAGGDLTGTYPNPTIANGAIALDELSDVVITTPAIGATLIYDGANWIDGALDLADNDARTGTLPVTNGGTGVTTSTGTGSTVLSASPTFTGTVACAAITPTSLVDISGAAAGQIKFPATQNPSADANTLDDYEEGSWTPTGNGVTLTLNGSQLYVKAGQGCIFNGDFTYPSTADGGNADVSGLPFTSSSGNTGIAIGLCTLGSVIFGLTLSGSASVRFVDINGSTKTNANMSTVRVIIGGAYRTNG